MKVERVSYPVMTPSAARGVLEAIFWKPEMRWQVRQIHVLKPIRYFSILRNEVNSRASEASARRRLRDNTNYFAEDDRAQRNTLALRDVSYLIQADVQVGEGVEEHEAKFRDQFRRRVQRGQCFHQPYLGCREFSAFFNAPDGSERPIAHSEDLGRMFFDMAYGTEVDTQAEPRFFDVALDQGVVRVPEHLYQGKT